MELQKQRLCEQYCPKVVRLISCITICTGIIVLFSHVYHIPLVTNIVFTWNTMKVNTAICFILSGMALFLTQQKNDYPITSLTSVIISLIVMLISGLTLYEYIFSSDLGIDNIFFQTSIDHNRSFFPSRMVIPTAINLFLMGIAIIFINIKKTNPWIHQSIAWLIYMIAFFSLCNYIFGSGSKMYPVVLVSTIAFTSTILFLLLSFAILIAKLNVGMIEILFDDDIVGMTLRMMLPFILTVPVFIVVLENIGSNAGLYNDRFGDSINVVGSIAIFTILFAILGRILKKEQIKRVSTEIKLQDTEILFREFVNNMDAVFYKTNDKCDRILYVNPAFEKIWGYQAEDLYKNPRLWIDVILLQDKDKVEEQFFNKIQHEPHVEVEYRIRRPDGSIRYIYDKGFQLKENNHLTGIIGIAIDTTETLKLKKYNKIELYIPQIINSEKNIEEIYLDILQIICEIFEWDIGEMWIKEENKPLLRCMKVFYKDNNPKLSNFSKIGKIIAFGKGLTGYVWKKKQPILNDFSKLNSQEAHAAGLRIAIGVPIIYHDNVIGVMQFFRKDEEQPDAEFIRYLEDLGGRIGKSVHNKMLEYNFINLAKYDYLTELLNATTFEEKLNAVIASGEFQYIGVMIIDIDRFYLMNETFGHKKADELLKEVGLRIKASLKDSANQVARLDADKFVIYLDQIKYIEQLPDQAHLIQLSFKEPFIIENETITLSVSIGISTCPQDGIQASELIAKAHQALYAAKDLGRNSIQLYATEMNREATKKLILEKELKTAIANEQFIFYFQPQIDLKNGDICGAEALIRWQHPEKGIVSPQNFISYAEETGLIITINEYALLTIFKMVNSNWFGPPISVNISPLQFKNGFRLLEYIERLIDEFKVEPKNIDLEITENILMQNLKHNLAIFAALNKLGFCISLDDFGTGFSSFGYLPRIPVSKVKIDQSFIRGLPQNKEHVLIVKSIINLIHSLHMKVVAEGVETEEQLNFLKEENCDIVQGYYYYKPMPLDEFIQLLKLKY